MYHKVIFLKLIRKLLILFRKHYSNQNIQNTMISLQTELQKDVSVSKEKLRLVQKIEFTTTQMAGQGQSC